MSWTKDANQPPAKLILTFFARSRPSDPKASEASIADHDPSGLLSKDGSGFDKIKIEDFQRVLVDNILGSEANVAAASLKGTKPDAQHLSKHVWQFTYRIQPPLPDFSRIRQNIDLKLTEQIHECEIAYDVVPHPAANLDYRPIKLALFDMDSTLINEEVIDELARTIGKTDIVSAITTRAMNGEIDFATSLQERVAMLKGVKADVWTELKRVVTIANGARELVRGLKDKGVVTGVISGGFAPMAEWLKGELGLDYAFANHLLTSPSTPSHPYPHLTGALSPDHPIITPELKRDTLLRLTTEHSVSTSETLVVGDGSNDLLMLHAAGIGIAYKAKATVQEKAPMRLNGGSLADILYLFGRR